MQDLAPIAILALPCLSLNHSLKRSLGVSDECKIATVSPNAFLNLANIWGVNDISGTNIIAVLFCFKAFFIQFM